MRWRAVAYFLLAIVLAAIQFYAYNPASFLALLGLTKPDTMNGFAFNLVLIFHVLIGIGLIVFVLVQHGKGADLGASFGSGASGSLFGASGSANFLSRTTAILATLFFVTSLTLSWLGKQSGSSEGKTVYDTMPVQSAPAAVTPAPASAPQSQK